MATLRVLQVNLCRLLSRLGKSFKSTTVLPARSIRAQLYIQIQRSCHTESTSQSFAPGLRLQFFLCPKQTLEGHGYPKSSCKLIYAASTRGNHMVAKAQKKFRVGASKGMRHESAAQVCTTHIWRSPRKLRKNDSQEKCFCQSYNCAVECGE